MQSNVSPFLPSSCYVQGLCKHAGVNLASNLKMLHNIEHHRATQRQSAQNPRQSNCALESKNDAIWNFHRTQDKSWPFIQKHHCYPILTAAVGLKTTWELRSIHRLHLKINVRISWRLVPKPQKVHIIGLLFNISCQGTSIWRSGLSQIINHSLH